MEKIKNEYCRGKKNWNSFWQVDPSLERDKQKENRVKNVGCDYYFQDNPVKCGDATRAPLSKPRFPEKSLLMLDINWTIKVDGTSMA